MRGVTRTTFIRKRVKCRIRFRSRAVRLAKILMAVAPRVFRGVAPFPQDQRAEHGFDNQADHLTLSPLLMESFLTLSQTIVESPDLNRSGMPELELALCKTRGPARRQVRGRESQLAETTGEIHREGYGFRRCRDSALIGVTESTSSGCVGRRNGRSS